MDSLGQYTIIGPLGSGGMGEVYHAYDPRLERRVAIKVLPARLSTDRDARERLRREAMAAAALDHPFICKVFEIGEVDGALFIVMEYVDGETLHGRSFPLPEALRLAGEIAEALEDAHKRGFVHRDLKPSNVMVTTQGHVKVMDFGLAKRIAVSTATSEHDATRTSMEAPLTGMGLRVGTPAYMSPEQAAGDPVDHRSDLFSFGILLCEMATAKHPFRRPSSSETLAAVLRDPPDISGDLPPGFVVLVRRLLAKSPSERQQSMSEVREILGRIAAGDGEPPAAAPNRLPVIGRDPERAELRRRLNEALAGRGSLVLIGGEPGIGKTHITQELLAEARHRGCFAVTGHCYEMEGAPPYVPFIETLEYSARVLPPTAFRRAIGDAAPEVAKLMPELRRLFPDIPPAIDLPPEQQRRFLFNSYREFIERSCAMTPLVVLFEDLHWGDEPTLQLLHHLAPALASLKMLMIGTYRDVELDVTRPFARILESLLRGKLGARISLRRLPVDGVQSMLAALSGQAPPPSLARVIFEETEGNPFFVEEVFRHLAEEGLLFDDAGAWRPGLRPDDLQVPEGVRLVIGRRLARLGDEARRVLTTAAVIGRSFSLPLLEAVESTRPDAALDAVEEAERAQLVSAEPAGREPRYRFVHELVRQTLAETLSLPRRQRLHARVADAIERTYASAVDAHASAIALHLYQAGAAADPEKTAHYLTIASRRAASGAAHEEALSHLENALSLWEGERDARVADLLAQKATALRSLGRHDSAQQALIQAIEMFAQAGEPAKAAAAGLELAMLYSWRPDHERSAATLREAQGILGDADEYLKVRLLLVQAVGESVSGHPQAASDTLEAARRIAARLSRKDLDAYVDWVEAVHSQHSRQYARCIAASRRAAAAARALGDPWLVTEVEFNEINALLYSGQPGEAGRLAAESAVRAERIGNRNAYWVCKVHGTMIALAEGDLAAAERACGESFEVSQRLKTRLDFWDYLLRGIVQLARGSIGESIASLRHAVEREPPGCFHGSSISYLFATLAETGDPDAIDILERNPPPLPTAGQLNSTGSWFSLERTVAGLADLGRTEQLSALYPLTEELIATGGWGNPSRMFQTAAGLAAAAGENWSRAEEHHRIAVYQADKAPYRVVQPNARECYGRMLIARGTEGDRERARLLFAEALAQYESMGMPWHAKTLSARLACL